MQWVIAIAFVVALAALGLWVLRSFKRRPSARDERTSFIWGRRGGGDF